MSALCENASRVWMFTRRTLSHASRRLLFELLVLLDVGCRREERAPAAAESGAQHGRLMSRDGDRAAKGAAR